MNSREMKRRFSASATTVQPGIHVRCGHPNDGGILIQSELSAKHKQQTGHRFHCLDISDHEALIRAIRRAAAYSRRLRKTYLASIGKGSD